MEEVEIREMNDGKGMGPRSISQYDDTFHSMSAHEALKDAANQLFPLADYMEEHFVPSDQTTETRDHHSTGPHLDGGPNFVQGGEYLLQALNAFTANITDLVDGFNEKLINLDQDIRLLNHKVDIANAMLRIKNQKQAMNGIKKFTAKKDPKELELPGPGHTRAGEFSVDSMYRRTRVVYNKYDEIGRGHQIHIDKFEDETSDRASEIQKTERGTANFLTVGKDTDSLTSRTSSYTRLSSRTTHSRTTSAFPSRPTKSSFPTLPHNSTFQGVKEKRKPSLVLKTTEDTLIEVSPEIKVTVPSFPIVPDSPQFIPPEMVAPQAILRQESFDFAPPPNDDQIFDGKDSIGRKESVAFLPPPPDAPPPDLAVLRDDKTNRMDGNDTEDVYSRLSMIPEPDF